MSKPSNNWLLNLMVITQEAHAETDMSFVAFLETLLADNGMYGDSRYDDHKLSQALQLAIEKNYTFGTDLALGKDYQVLTPAPFVDEEKSLNES